MKTIAMTPDAEAGYFPMEAILARTKTHTVRKGTITGDREITVQRIRTGVVLRFTRAETMSREEFLTDEFARADGLPSAEILAKLLRRFYGRVPETMVCNHFEVVEEAQGGR